jgi:hypothetical protein
VGGTSTLDINGYTILVAADPAVTLEPALRSSLQQGLIPVARKAFGTDAITESDILLHALEVAHGVFVRQGDVHVAFSSASPVGTSRGEVAYMQGTAIHPDFKRTGMYQLLIALRLLMLRTRPSEPAFLATRTQSPLVARRFSEFRPYPLFEQPDDGCEAVAIELAPLIFEEHSDFHNPSGLDFDAPTGVFRRAYEGSMYPEMPRSGDAGLDDKFRALLDFDQGDAFLLVAPFNPAVVRSMLATSLDRLGASQVQRAAVFDWASLS